MSDMPSIHSDRWRSHSDTAEHLLELANRAGLEEAAALGARAQAHATLAHTHAYLMVEALR